MAVRCLPDGRWIVYWNERTPEGKTEYKRLYFGRGPSAEARARRKNDEMGFLSRRPEKEPEHSGPLFFELSKAYSESKPFNDNSLEQLKIRLSANILPFFGHLPVMEITEATADQYVKKRIADGVKFSTIARELTDVKAILSWSATRKIIPSSPLKDYKKPREDLAIIAPPTREEAESIYREASPHLRRAFLLAAHLGLRPGAVELLSLKWSAVNLKTGTITITSARKGGPISRHVPIHAKLHDLMKQWADEDSVDPAGKEHEISGIPIVHYYGQPIKSLKKTWQNTLKRAGITRRLRMYDLRHYFITRVLENGADIKAVSQIVGSSPLTIMRHYQHVSEALLRETVKKIDPVDT